MNKTCTNCGESKPLAAFRGRNDGHPGYRSHCNKCQQSNYDAWAASHSRNVKGYQLRSKYGIDLEDFEIWLAAQKGQCRICKTTEPGGRGKFHVDHCHTTKHLRGLLCAHCNTGLGLFKDNPSLLREAALYLERTARRA